MAKEDNRKGKIDKALQGVDMRGIGDPGLLGRIVNTEVGTPEQVATFDALREVVKPYEDYFNGLADSFVGQKSLQPGVTAPKYQDHWKPQFRFKVSDDSQGFVVTKDAGITFFRHRTGKFPFWKHNFTPKQFEVGNDAFKKDGIEFDDEGRIKGVRLKSVKLNEHAAGIFTGSINENMGADDLDVSLDASKNTASISVSLTDDVNRTRERRYYYLLDDGNFWGRDRNQVFTQVELKGVIDLMKFAMARIQKLPPKEPPAESPQTPQE